jgi:hypothetical protein
MSSNLLALLLLSYTCAHAAGVGGDVTLATCTIAQFFDASSVSCGTCPSPSLPAAAAGGGLITASGLAGGGGGDSCGCPVGFMKAPVACASPTTAAGCYTCVSCAATGQGVSASGAACVTCNGTSALVAASGRCECPESAAVASIPPLPVSSVEYSYNGALYADCVTCPARTARAPADPARCVGCGGDPYISYGGPGVGCVCDTGYSITGVAAVGALQCVPATALTALTADPTKSEALGASVTFTSAPSASGTYMQLGSVLSQLLKHYYAASMIKCAAWVDATSSPSCQALAHVCALAMYSGPACTGLASLLSPPGQRTVQTAAWGGWGVGMPNMFYVGDVPTLLASTALAQQMAFDATKNPSAQVPPPCTRAVGYRARVLTAAAAAARFTISHGSLTRTRARTTLRRTRCGSCSRGGR